MNTASQDYPRHLGVLRKWIEHPTDYEKAFYYFLEEFAGDAPFLEASQPEEAPGLLAVLRVVSAKALGEEAALGQSRLLRLPAHGFLHGNAVVSGRVVIFFYFEDLNSGVLAIVPGVNGAVEIARFRLPSGLGGSPRNN